MFLSFTTAICRADLHLHLPFEFLDSLISYVLCVCVCIPARLSSLSLPSLFSVYSFIHSFVCLYPYSPCLLHTVCTSAALVIFFENGKKMNHTSSLFTSCLLSPFKTPQFKIFQNLLCTFLNSHNKVAQRTWVYKERRREKWKEQRLKSP